jgi:hypothetical protein
MGYASPSLVERVFTQSLTSATQPSLSGKGNLINFGNTLDKNLITDEIMNQHINMADTFINSTLSVLYKTPLKEVADLECKMTVDVDAYNGELYLVSPQANVFVAGDVVVIIDGVFEEKHVVESVANDNMLMLEENLSGYYSAQTSRILRVRFPDPIPNTSARLAAASIYERYFASQSSVQTSEFAKTLRNQAKIDINNILNGRTVLHGQHRIGDRFVNSNLKDRYGLRNVEGDSSRDIGDL